MRSNAEKDLWNAITGAYSAEQFNDGDVPLLIAYVRTKLLGDRNYRLLMKEGELIENDKGTLLPNPRLKIWKDCCGTLSSIATKLRIAPNARERIDVVQHSSKRAQAGKVFDPNSDWRSFQTESSVN